MAATSSICLPPLVVTAGSGVAENVNSLKLKNHEANSQSGLTSAAAGTAGKRLTVALSGG